MSRILLIASQTASLSLPPSSWEEVHCATRVLASIAKSEQLLEKLDLPSLLAAREYLADQTPAELDQAIAAQERIDLDRSTPPGAGRPPSMRL